MLLTETVSLAERLILVRREEFGDDGILPLAESLGLLPGTWRNYEAGVSVPGLVLLKFVVLTGTNPQWLLQGDGPRFGHSKLAIPVSEN